MSMWRAKAFLRLFTLLMSTVVYWACLRKPVMFRPSMQSGAIRAAMAIITVLHRRYIGNRTPLAVNKNHHWFDSAAKAAGSIFLISMEE